MLMASTRRVFKPIPVGLMIRAVDSEQQTVENLPSRHLIMYPSCQAIEVRVVGADDNAGMSNCFPLVQPQKVKPVLREENSTSRRRKLEDLFVWHGPVGIARIV